MKFITVIYVHIQENLFGTVRNPSLLGHCKCYWQKRTESSSSVHSEITEWTLGGHKSSVHSEITVTLFASLAHGQWLINTRKNSALLYAFSSFCFLFFESYCNKCGCVMKKSPSQTLNSNIVEKRAPPSAKCCFLMLRCLRALLSSGCLDFSVFLQFIHPEKM